MGAGGWVPLVLMLGWGGFVVAPLGVWALLYQLKSNRKV
jgi:hypothetical protein